MPYEETIEKDIARAKKILAENRETFVVPGIEGPYKYEAVGFKGADIYPAYKLLESLVEEVDRLRLVESRAMKLLRRKKI